MRIIRSPDMRTTLELPDPLFARLKAQAALERVPLKRLLQAYVERGLAATASGDIPQRRAYALPRIDGPPLLRPDQLSNAGLFELLED
jgi:hypothetical protein